MNLDGVDKKEASRKSAEARKAASDAINAKGRATDRRKPGEIRNRRDSITSFCSECITSYGLDVGGYGSVLNAIRMCTSTECHLYPWRTGKLDTER